MTAHVRKGFEKWRSTFEDYADDVRFESAFRAGVRFEQGRQRKMKSCEWERTDDPDFAWWDTSCGEAWTFIVGGPAENKMEFCPYCGSSLVISPAGKREADKLREVLK